MTPHHQTARGVSAEMAYSRSNRQWTPTKSAAAIASSFALALSSFAQSAPVAPAPTKAEAETAPRKPVPVVTNPAADAEVVELSPFVVTSDKDVGYQAASTLAGTRLNTDIKDIGAAVSVYTQEFLSDINVTKLEDILAYTASTEGGGKNFSGVTGENASDVRSDPSSVNRVRALAQATRTRDFFPSDIPSDTFNFENLTVSRGPNAILAGIGNAGGIMDASMRKAGFKDSYRVSSRFSDYNSHREQISVNKVLIPQRLAVRFDLLNDDQQFRQKPADNKDQRFYTALQYRVIDPKKKDAFLGRGTFRANYEFGRIEGTPPDPLTPTFTLANWFNPTTAAGVSVPANARYQWWGYGTPLVNAPTAVQAPTLSALRNASGVGINPTGSSVVQGFPLYAQMALIFSDPNSNNAGVGFSDAALAGIQGFQGTIPATLPGGTGGSLRSSGDFNRLRTGFVRTRLQDANIFDYYNLLMTGAMDRRAQKFKAADFRYEQLFLGGKAGMEAAYNYQDFTSKYNFSIPTGGNDEGIAVDVNYYLSVKTSTGQPILNPNFGRPFISTTDVFRDTMNRIKRDSYQLTAFFKHDFTQDDGLTKWLGKHTFTGLFFNTNIERFNRTYSSTWDPSASPSPQASLNNALPGTFGTQVNGWFYVGPSLVNVANLSDVRLQPITAAMPQYGQSYKVQVYDPVSRTFVTSTQTPQRILQRLIDQREDLESSALALQSQFFKNYVTTIFGWREDRDQAYTSLTPTRLANGNLDDSAVVFQPSSSQGKRSWTKSVVARLPIKLPGNTEIRGFWNESGNFNPVGQRRNIWNEELGSPTANTEEHGFSVSTFNGKVFFKVNRYTTNIKSDSIAGVGNPYSYISTTINNMIAARDAGLNPANFNYNYAGWTSFSDVALAIYNTIPARMRANMGADKNFNPRFTGSGSTLTWNPESIINLASVSDTESRGTEFEMIMNPTRGWRVALSVAKNEAVKSNVAAEELAFAAEWKKNLDTMYDGKLLPGARSPAANQTGTFWDQYVAEHLISVRTAAALSGLPSPEIRKWRANFVTRYEFQSGILKGVNVGGSARWQDKIGIGYPLITENGVTRSDLTKPYWGEDDIKFDVSAGYTRKFRTAYGPVTWTLGVNVRNLNAKDELIPIKANADGSWGTFRIPPERSWTVTNSFAF